MIFVPVFQSRESRSRLSAAFETWREMDRQSRSRSNSNTSCNRQQQPPSKPVDQLASNYQRSPTDNAAAVASPHQNQAGFYPDLSFGSTVTKVSSLLGTTVSARESISKFSAIDARGTNAPFGRSVSGALDTGWTKICTSSSSLPGEFCMVSYRCLPRSVSHGLLSVLWSLASLLLPMCFSDLNYGPCPPKRESRVCALGQCLI